MEKLVIETHEGVVELEGSMSVVEGGTLQVMEEGATMPRYLSPMHWCEAYYLTTEEEEDLFEQLQQDLEKGKWMGDLGFED